jgi:hypothetical protein
MDAYTNRNTASRFLAVVLKSTYVFIHVNEWHIRSFVNVSIVK